MLHRTNEEEIEMRTMKALNLLSALLIASATLLAQNSRDPEAGVREVINRFEAGLQQHDLQAIEALVAPDIVVFENGRRNDGWQDFRDHHLLPEFKAHSTPYRTEIVRIEATPSLAWGYSRMNRAYPPKKDNTPDVWTMYALRREGTGWKIAMLGWSVRRIE
jgi:ketosteroid isomerase-like protein